MPPDLLLLLCDTARADAFAPWGGRLRTPTMDRLCHEGVSFGQATSQAPWTLSATASIFSGRLPTEHGITGDCFEWADGKPTSPAEAVRGYDGPWLPESLGERGYRTWAASCNTWISEWGGFDRGFERLLDFRDRTRLPKGTTGDLMRRARRMWGTVDRGGGQALDAFAQRLGEAGPEPLFAFVNLMEVHAPYDPPRPFYPYAFWRRAKTRRYSGGTEKARRYLSYNTRVAEPPADYVETVKRLYYHAARYEDWLLGRFLQVVAARGRPTVVAIVSDHGENLGEQRLFNHNSSLAQTLLHVPLVVWGQRIEVGQGRVDEPVPLLGLAGALRSLVDGDGFRPLTDPGGARSNGAGSDVAIVSEYESTVVHTSIPGDIQAMLARDPSSVPPLVFHPGVAVRKGSLKYVAGGDGSQALFELASDPGEEWNLLPERPDAAAPFAPYRQAWEHRRAAQPLYRAGDIAEDEIADHLRTLGYID